VANTLRLVDEAVARGAVVATGGKAVDGPGSFFEPTVLDRVSADMSVAFEEIFAPVVGIQRFSTEDEAISLAGWPNTRTTLSNYRVPPLAVVFPRSAEAWWQRSRCAGRPERPLISRGGGHVNGGQRDRARAWCWTSPGT
jgi:hypothetical protein